MVFLICPRLIQNILFITYALETDSCNTREYWWYAIERQEDPVCDFVPDDHPSRHLFVGKFEGGLSGNLKVLVRKHPVGQIE